MSVPCLQTDVDSRHIDGCSGWLTLPLQRVQCCIVLLESLTDSPWRFRSDLYSNERGIKMLLILSNVDLSNEGIYLLRTTGFFVIAIAFIGFLQTNWTDHRTTTDTCIIDFIATPMLTIVHSTHILCYRYSIYGIWLWIAMTG